MRDDNLSQQPYISIQRGKTPPLDRLFQASPGLSDDLPRVCTSPVTVPFAADAAPPVTIFPAHHPYRLPQNMNRSAGCLPVVIPAYPAYLTGDTPSVPVSAHAAF